MRLIFLFISLALSYIVNAQYTMSNQTVDDCFGTLSDSEANTQQTGWYDHNENYTFTICPNGRFPSGFALIAFNFSGVTAF